MTPIEKILAELFSAIRPRLGPRVPTPRLIEEMLSEISMENKSKELLGRQATASGIKGTPVENQWQALFTALAAGLNAPPGQEVVVAAERLQAEFGAIAPGLSQKWLAFVPLTGSTYNKTIASFDLETLEVPCAILPALSGANLAKVLQAINQRFAIETPMPDESWFQQVSFVSAYCGTAKYAAEKALSRLAAVRDAIRYARLVMTGSSGFMPGIQPHISADSIRRLEVLLCPADEGRPSVEPVWAVDVSVEVETVLLGNARWREWYDRAMRLLITNLEPQAAGQSTTIGPRLARSIRIMARACSQANLDIRFLLCLVALETLASVSKESIAESVADIGARVLAADSQGRAEVFRDLKDAYDTRSRFVHSGELPTLAVEAKVLDRLQNRVLDAWAKLSHRFFDLVDRGLSEKQLSAGFEDFRGITPFKYGATWEEAFRHPGAVTQ